MTNELKSPKTGRIFWSDECADANAAISFAIDHCDDHYDRLDFLISWRDGDVTHWPDFIKKVSK